MISPAPRGRQPRSAGANPDQRGRFRARDWRVRGIVPRPFRNRPGRRPGFARPPPPSPPPDPADAVPPGRRRAPPRAGSPRPPFRTRAHRSRAGARRPKRRRGRPARIILGGAAARRGFLAAAPKKAAPARSSPRAGRLSGEVAGKAGHTVLIKYHNIPYWYCDKCSRTARASAPPAGSGRRGAVEGRGEPRRQSRHSRPI